MASPRTGPEREAWLADLERRYVTRDAGGCRTDPAIARQARPVLEAALADPDAEVRRFGVAIARLVGGDLPEAFPGVRAGLADPSPAVRIEALETLSEAFPRLVHLATGDILACLGSSDAEERAAAALALGVADRGRSTSTAWSTGSRATSRSCRRPRRSPCTARWTAMTRSPAPARPPRSSPCADRDDSSPPGLDERRLMPHRIGHSPRP